MFELEGFEFKILEIIGFSIMDNTLAYRNIGLKIQAYYNSGNYPGVVEEAVWLVWETIWIQNIYFD